MGSIGERVPGWVRWIAVAIGIALAATGAVAVFVTNNSAGAGSLVAAGVVIGALGMFANAIESVKGGGLEIVLARAAASALDAAAKAEQQGHGDVAQALREQASRLISDVAPFASEYERMRRDRPSGWERTLDLEHLSAKSAKALAPYFDRAAIEELFNTGAEGNRWAAIVLMEHNPAIASYPVVAEVLRNPLSRFELYHALKVIEGMASISALSDVLAGLLNLVEQENREGRLGPPDSDVGSLAERLLARAGRPG